MKNRILIFVHYNRQNDVAGYVLYWLEHLKPIFSRIIFVSNSKLGYAEKENLELFCDEILERKNEGFDFGAWKEAIFTESLEQLSTYDSLTLMNDTCFGPLFDIQEYYKIMESKEVDFWGNSMHESTKKGMPGTNTCIPSHIQSYFFVFNQNIIQSKEFKEFWESVNEKEKNVLKIIQKYETQLTQKLTQTGFVYKVYVESQAKEYKDMHPNLLLIYPDICIQKKSPFLKVKSFLFFKDQESLIRLILEKTTYPLDWLYLLSRFQFVNKTLETTTKENLTWKELLIEIIKFCIRGKCRKLVKKYIKKIY